jgi:hypothetical protein
VGQRLQSILGEQGVQILTGASLRSATAKAGQDARRSRPTQGQTSLLAERVFAGGQVPAL